MGYFIFPIILTISTNSTQRPSKTLFDAVSINIISATAFSFSFSFCFCFGRGVFFAVNHMYYLLILYSCTIISVCCILFFSCPGVEGKQRPDVQRHALGVG